MDRSEREDFLRGLAGGTTALRDVGRLSGGDVDAIARVGAAALQGGRYALAEQVFDALVALEPDVPLHLFHLALARQGRGDIDGAVVAVTAQLQACAGVDDDDVARALLLRAELRGRADRDQALADLAAARDLTSPAARAVVDAAWGAPRPAGSHG
jgi:hypothetical protein